MLAAAQFTPLFGAILICWIFSVCIHEFAHALAAYWGGDKSVVQKGYLYFNLFAYVHPVYSIVIPCVFLMMGSLPLPGGAVYVDRHALRGKHWATIVSAAGPASNFILFLILVVLVHPAAGLIDPDSPSQPAWAVVLGAICVLELWSVLFNLIPVPPFDGFGIVEPYLAPDVQQKLRPLGMSPLIVVYFLFSADPVMDAFMNTCDTILNWFDLPWNSTWRAYNIAFFGSSE